MRIIQKENKIKREKERIAFLKKQKKDEEISKKNELIQASRNKNEKKIESLKDFKNKVIESNKNNDKLTQITVINKSDLKSGITEENKNNESIKEIREDVNKVKKILRIKLTKISLQGKERKK